MDMYEKALMELEGKVMKLPGVEALVQGVYIPNRIGGAVALSINQGHDRGGMNPQKMAVFVGMLIRTLEEYRRTLVPAPRTKIN